MYHLNHENLRTQLEAIFQGDPIFKAVHGSIVCCLSRCYPCTVSRWQYEDIVSRLGGAFRYSTAEQDRRGVEPDVYVLCMLRDGDGSDRGMLYIVKKYDLWLHRKLLVGIEPWVGGGEPEELKKFGNALPQSTAP